MMWELLANSAGGWEWEGIPERAYQDLSREVWDIYHLNLMAPGESGVNK